MNVPKARPRVHHTNNTTILPAVVSARSHLTGAPTINALITRLVSVAVHMSLGVLVNKHSIQKRADASAPVQGHSAQPTKSMTSMHATAPVPIDQGHAPTIRYSMKTGVSVFARE